MWLALITLMTALAISATAAYFSIVGLAALFAASFWGVIIMGSVLEAGKLVAATWLHSNWHNPLVSKFHKFYLTVAVIVVMFITSLGIFGFLSKAHLDQKAPIQKELVNIESIKDQLEFKKEQLEKLEKQLQDINNLIEPGKRNWRLETQRDDILKEMKVVRKQIDDLNAQLLENKHVASEVDVKLGPVVYLAEIVFGDTEGNVDKAVQMFIVIIMFAFDPMAVALVLSATISFKTIAQWKMPIKEQQTVITEKFDPTASVDDIARPVVKKQAQKTVRGKTPLSSENSTKEEEKEQGKLLQTLRSWL